MRFSLKIILIIYCFTFSTFTKGQNEQAKIDSLLSVLKIANEDNDKLNLYFQILDKCDWQDNLKYAQAGLKITEKILSKTINVAMCCYV